MTGLGQYQRHLSHPTKGSQYYSPSSQFSSTLLQTSMLRIFNSINHLLTKHPPEAISNYPTRSVYEIKKTQRALAVHPSRPNQGKDCPSDRNGSSDYSLLFDILSLLHQFSLKPRLFSIVSLYSWYLALGSNPDRPTDGEYIKIKTLPETKNFLHNSRWECK